MLNTGTPQMQSVWMLLKHLGIVDVTLIQTSPPELANRSGTPEVRELKLEMEEWRKHFSRVTAAQKKVKR